MKEKIKYLDYFFVLRPTLFFPVWTVFLAGYHANLSFDVNKNAEVAQGNDPILVLALLSLLMGAVFIFNQFADIETDAKNKKLFFIADGIINQTLAKIEGLLLTIVPVGIAWYLDFKLGFIFLFVFFITGIVYSFEPFNWKDKPILGVIANFWGGWAVAACGWIAGGTTGWLFAVYAIPYAIGLVAVYLLTTIPDISGDEEAQKITFGVKYGTKATIWWATAFELLTVVSSYLLRDYILFIPALVAFPLFIITSVRLRLEDVLRTIKFTVLFASLAVCIVYPVYFLVILFNFYFSKWYYRKRFNLEYPKFAA